MRHKQIKFISYISLILLPTVVYTAKTTVNLDQAKMIVDIDERIKSMKVSQNGKFILLSTTNKKTTLWNLKKNKKIKHFDHLGADYSLIDLNSKKHQVLTSDKRSIKLWQAKSWKPSGFINKIFHIVNFKQIFSIKPNLNNTPKGKRLHRIKGKGFYRIENIELASKGRYLLTSFDLYEDNTSKEGALKLYNIKKQKAITTIYKKSSITQFALKKRNTEVVIGEIDGDISLLNLKNGKTKWKNNNAKTPVCEIKFSRFNNLIMVKTFSNIKLINPNTGEAQKTFDHYSKCDNTAFDPKSRYFLTQSDQRVNLWSLTNRKLLGSFYHQDKVTAMSFHPKKDFILTSSSGKIYRWPIKPLKILNLHNLISLINRAEKIVYQSPRKEFLKTLNQSLNLIKQSQLNSRQKNIIYLHFYHLLKKYFSSIKSNLVKKEIYRPIKHTIKMARQSKHISKMQIPPNNKYISLLNLNFLQASLNSFQHYTHNQQGVKTLKKLKRLTLKALSKRSLKRAHLTSIIKHISNKNAFYKKYLHSVRTQPAANAFFTAYKHLKSNGVN